MLTDLTLAQARDGLRGRGFSAVELTDAYLAAIAHHRLDQAYALLSNEYRAHHDARAQPIPRRRIHPARRAATAGHRNGR